WPFVPKLTVSHGGACSSALSGTVTCSWIRAESRAQPHAVAPSSAPHARCNDAGLTNRDAAITLLRGPLASAPPTSAGPAEGAGPPRGSGRARGWRGAGGG